MDLTPSGNAPIVVGVDDSERAQVAVRWAARAAAHRHAPLRLVYATGYVEVVYGALPPTEGLREAMRTRGAERLAAAAAVATDTAQVDVETVLVDDPPARALLAAAPDAQILVVGGSGHPGYLPGVLLGSLATQLASHADAPLVVVRGEDADRRPEREPVVVGVDGSPLSTEAIGFAFEEAALRGAPLLALHVWNDGDTTQVFSQARVYFDWEPVQETEERLLAERLAGWGEKYPDVVVERRVVQDKPADALIEASKHAQLVVVGSRGRGGLRGLLLGSTSQELIHHAACPVLVVRPESNEGASR